MKNMFLDQIDLQILEKLQENSKKKIFEIARELKIAPSTVFNRIKKLEKEKVILGYSAVVDPKKLGKNVTAIVHIITGGLSAFEVAEKLGQKVFVEEVFTVSGEFDIIAKIRFKDNDELGNFIYDPINGLKTWKGIQRTESMMVLKSFKENGIAIKKTNK